LSPEARLVIMTDLLAKRYFVGVVVLGVALGSVVSEFRSRVGQNSKIFTKISKSTTRVISFNNNI
jgi:hypothetical protein